MSSTVYTVRNKDKDTGNSHHSGQAAFWAWHDAERRSSAAKKKHKKFFQSNEHVDRLFAVMDITKAFFGTAPNYITARGLGQRKPFEVVKYHGVGSRLSNHPLRARKQKDLYDKLAAIPNIKIVNKDGHFSVQIHPAA
jgi:hypothetical protein